MKINDIPVIETDVLVIGGGTAGPMAAVTAKEQDPGLNVMLLEKANVKRSGAISMGMDGLNNAVVPGHATPEQYVKEITIANDGIVHQPALMAYATRSFPMIEKLDSWGVHFQKDETGDYDMKNDRSEHTHGGTHHHSRQSRDHGYRCRWPPGPANVRLPVRHL